MHQRHTYDRNDSPASINAIVYHISHNDNLLFPFYINNPTKSDKRDIMFHIQFFMLIHYIKERQMATAGEASYMHVTTT